MNIFISQQGWSVRFVAAVAIAGLLLSAFPASFFVAQAEGEIVSNLVTTATPAALVEDGGEGDLCDNMLGDQLEVPPGYQADGSACYPVDTTETITLCKYSVQGDETSEPIAGWKMTLENDDEGVDYEVFNLTTGADGCVSQDVDVNNGPWYAYEDMQEGWYQDQVITPESGQAYQGDGPSYPGYCAFFGYELTSKSLIKDTPSEYICEFYNVDDREEVTGYKWSDENNNGIHEEEEPGVSGWAITATDIGESDYAPVTTTTDNNGMYTLLLPEDGVWVITEESRSRWTQTAVYQNGTKLTEENIELGSITECRMYLNEKYSARVDSSDSISVPFLYNRCDFLNHREQSNGGSGTKVKNRTTSTPTGAVLGASTSTPACTVYLNDYMRQGNAASSTQVTKLQIFLNAVGIKVEITGTFDAATDAAVRAFQAKHKADVLTPWFKAGIVPHENPTGWVYQLTRWKINNIVCPGSEAYPVLN